MSHKILIPRPKEQGDATALELKEFGYDCLVEPMLQYQKMDFDLPEWRIYDGIIITSLNALLSLDILALKKQIHPKTKFFCVGEKTPHMLKSHGIKGIGPYAQNAQNLADILWGDKKLSKKRFLYLRGVHASTNLPALLKNEGAQVDELIVYDMPPVTTLSASALYHLKTHTLQGVLFFSTRTAQTFLNLIDQHDLTKPLQNMKVLCLSQSIADHVRPYKWKGVHYADTPDIETMFNLIKTTCKPVK